MSDKLKEKLTQENIAQLIEKFLNNHRTRNIKNPQIVGITTSASQMKNVSKIVSTKITTTKPKAFDLKMAPPKEGKSNLKNTSTSQGKKKSSQKVASIKRRPASNGSSKSKTHLPIIETSSKSPNDVNKVKNYKTKIYEKEIDILLQKIEKLEKQQNVKIEKEVIPEKVANSELFKGKPSEIANKIKGFLSGVPAEENLNLSNNPEPHSPANDWQPSGQMPPQPPPLPPPILPMPFMPIMPLPPHSNDDAMPPSSSQPISYPHSMEQYSKEPMKSSYQDFTPILPKHSSNIDHFSQTQHNRPQSEYLPNDASENYPSYMSPMASTNGKNLITNQASFEPIHDSTTNGEGQMSTFKRKKGLFRKFKLSNILNSVIPRKGKKNKQLDQNAMKDNRNIHESNPPFDPMIPQESQMYPNVDRGQPMYAEQPGMSINIGGGPIGGGGHVKANPVGFLRSMLPLSGLPKWINGKVVLGIVLENGIGKKPKTIFQHFSTGKIRR